MKKTMYAALAAMILAIGCGGSGGEAAEPTPAPVAADGEQAGTDSTGAAAVADPAAPAADATPATAATGPVSDDELAQAFAVMQAMAKAVTDNKGDCAKTAAALDTSVTDAKPLLERMKADQDAQQRWDAKYKDQVQPLMMGMMSDLGPCMQDPAVLEVMKKLQ